MSTIPTLATVIDNAGEGLGSFLPRLGGALLLLLAGLLAARLVARLVGKSLERLGVDRQFERWGVLDVLDRAGLGRSLVTLIARAIRSAADRKPPVPGLAGSEPP